ncbi:DUF1489 family protein [Sphingomicrobium astaxanthinifaciens]|uniref:DUF1489 family protein n=2 Tax=Sphingomicrobium astaxanthinifaciens TaxID=1227949 RepID=UPI001FCC677B|nr:DUF1489 family protein [Sphingomicrobium astaxanthinifaciens]MCJ7421357.1 DUF1489 domain-containing protein [Sphingomicrobium astaxanthinifaciens]
MSCVHMTKVAYGCASLPTLEKRIARRASGGKVRIVTKRRPVRHAEVLNGGRLHWIVKHRIVARSQVLAFEERKDGRWDIVLSDRLEPCAAFPKRAHQGWRYLEDKDAPGEEDDGSGIGQLPPRLYGKLAALALV